jgi:nicotinate-nucleotide--dimethylbenzimidazole phosphoribosyltransferase
VDDAAVSCRQLFDDSLAGLPGGDLHAHDLVAARASGILRPSGALARLDTLAVWVARWQGTTTPSVVRPAALIFAADHGVVAEGVSAYPGDVTAAMLDAFRAGRSSIDALARTCGASVRVHDVGVGRPTGNLRVEPAMTEASFAEAFTAGRLAVRTLDADLLVVGEMGIGNTTSAAAVCARLLGGPPAGWVGRGTGVDDDRLHVKQHVVADAVARTADLTHAADVLRHLGGHELVAMAGAFVEARRRGLPVLLDGYVCTAALVALWCIEPAIVDHVQAGHCSAEHAHRAALTALGMEPLLDLGLRLGEGSGAMAAVPLVAMACRAVVEVPTFAEWFGT